MFIGHFAIAFILILLFPHVPVWVPLVGVSFPDLLWAVLIWARKEEVIIDRGSPLQRFVVFKKYPYSHSLVLTNVITLGIGGGLALGLGNATVLPVFVFAAASHWFLDTIVHLADLPVLGFDGDRKVGFGLWRWGRTAFVVEFLMFFFSAGLFVETSAFPAVLLVGLVAHGANANSFLGLTKKNTMGSSNGYAALALFGFGLVTVLYSFIL